ncbi:MAG: hypothetical protein K5762_05810 [Bacilli bacterium]|nr:hypothetical protein [Bacilli bacterium]
MNYTIEEKYELIRTSLLKEIEKNPIVIVKKIMHQEFINIHGPEHHFLDGAAFLTALRNNGLNFDYDQAMDELAKRTIKMPGAMCGYWGVCGATASIGAVFSILDGTTPISDDKHYKEHMEFTSKLIARMAEIGGPRCCKRNAFLAISMGVQYVKERYGISIPLGDIQCEFSSWNKQCIGSRCPFHQ